MSEIKAQEAEGADGSKVQTQAGDLELLAALIECEAGGEPYEGKLAVGSVVLNRVASSHFPNSVVGVIYQRGQFSPVASGRFANRIGKGEQMLPVHRRHRRSSVAESRSNVSISGEITERSREQSLAIMCSINLK